MRLLVPLMIIALTTAWGCARRAEEVIVVPTCDCEEPCPDCDCEEEAGTGAGPASAETPASARNEEAEYYP